METVLKAISDWIKSLLTAAIMSNLSGLFDDVNTQVGGIAQQVGTKPSSFEPRVFAMIEALSRNVVLPIAGVILTFIACYELIQLITEHNNMAQFEPALLMKWIFKTAISVWMISNTFDIIMAVFDVTQQVVANSSGIISGNTRVNDIGLSMLQSSMMQMDVGPLFGLFLQSFFIGITMRIERSEMEPETFMTEIKEMISSLVTTTEAAKGANALMKNKIIGVCPNCGKPVVEREKGWFCENRECRFVLWKDNAFLKRLGKRMDAHVADKLLRDGRVRLKDCKSAKGKTYNATVLLSCEADGRSKFSLEFEGGC